MENLSWRLWNRETFCCDGSEEPTIASSSSSSSSCTSSTNLRPSRPTSIRSPKIVDSQTFSDIPELSSSVDSAPSDDELPKIRDRSEGSGKENRRPCIIRGGSIDRYRGKEKHMTPIHLARIMEDIDRRKTQPEEWMRDSLSRKASPEPSRPIPPTQEVPRKEHHESSSQKSITESSSRSPPHDVNNDDGNQSSLRSTHSVVRGFSPSRISSSYRSTTKLAASPSPIKAKTPIPAPVAAPAAKKKQPMFFLGSSASSHSDDDLEESYRSHKSRFGDHHVKSQMTSGISNGLRAPSVQVIESEDDDDDYDDDYITEDDDDVSESAIEEDDEWEDDGDESIPASEDESKIEFKRVDSRPNLVSRRSLIAAMLHGNDRATSFAQQAQANSRSTSALPRRSAQQVPLPQQLAHVQQQQRMQQQQANASGPRPIIMTTSNIHHPLALSPRTTRRNMVQTELTESLRKHLLWERQQKTATAAAVLKRRHTSHDVSKLTEYPQPAQCAAAASGEVPGRRSGNNSWNAAFDHTNEYHATGW